MARVAGVISALYEFVIWLQNPGWWLQTLWRWGRVFWVCRVPAASAFCGGYLLAATPQARDLFADLGMRWWQWLAFFGFVFGWAWLVHASARRALQQDYWVPEAHTEAGLSDTTRLRLQILFFVPAVLVPRILGLAVFVFIASAMARTAANLNTALYLPEAAAAVALMKWLIGGLVVVAFVYIGAMWRPRTECDWLPPGPGNPEPPLLAHAKPLVSEAVDTLRHVTRGENGSRSSYLLGALRSVVTLLLIFALVQPHIVASWMPRLFFAPLLFGSIVLLVGELALWAHRWRTPLLLLLVLLSAGLLWFFDRFHDVRWIDASALNTPVTGPERQIGTRAAVERWMVANNCSGADCPRPIIIAGAGGASRAAFLTASVVGALMDLGRNPATKAEYGNIRNRIFAISSVSGGSVGALTVRAALADAAQRGDPDKPPCTASGTGSWFGFDGRRPREAGYDATRSWRDCFQVLLAGDYLTPVLLGLAVRDPFPLGSPLSGMPFWDDRAALLEQGFERRYHRLTSADNEPRSCGNVNGGKAEPADKTGLCRPFGWHPDPKQIQGAWLPLLFINGTSVAAGRRIIVSDIRVGDKFFNPKKPEQLVPLFPLAHDLNEIRAWAPPVTSMSKGGIAQKQDDPRDTTRDIRLSTAATMSARFPLISPHGNLRDRTGDVVDRIVDGGYFENDGLATAADLVQALRMFGLFPVVIRVVNEPVARRAEDRQLGPDRPDIPNDGEGSVFDGVTSIFRALTAVRSGHEEGHAAYLRSVIDNHDFVHEFNVLSLIASTTVAVGRKRAFRRNENPLCRHDIKEEATLEHVSMSWWMSQPVQAYLDAQLCVQANTARLLCELRNGKKSDGLTCPITPD
ncbi:hypothetical protein [Variibacter gotjawalensis]|uniref:hypothetical protein n=1 Tax=Variibacter gotjawalensis TaxID=1333996 RepID=UPI00102B2EC9|nr:hypothetical protein [Variibacter gotjawalensis]NIK46010.1 hypothetical protein [Variibacter gotjawalensis]